MNEITIVTAFFDIGRGDWTPDKGLPHYLQRTTDTYIERFSHMAQLENELVVFSTPDMIEKLIPLRRDKLTRWVPFDFFAEYSDLIKKITTDERLALESIKTNVNLYFGDSMKSVITDTIFVKKAE